MHERNVPVGRDAQLLVVDDFAPLRRVVRELAVNLGYARIEEAADGAAGVAAADRVRPDVVVMDYCMPGLNGVEATREIVRRHAGVDVVAFSSADDAAVATAFAEAGASAYVEKADVEGLVDELSRRLPVRAA